MTPSEITIFVSIHLLVPATGLVAYFILCRRLLATGVSRAFLVQLFLIFVCYGGVLLVILTSLFWRWSGMASLGVFFLVLGAPILLAPISISLWKQKRQSVSHRVAFRVCLGYYVFLAVMLGLAMIIRLMGV